MVILDLEIDHIISLDCVERLCVQARNLTKICLRGFILRDRNALDALITNVANACSHLKHLYVITFPLSAGMISAAITAHVITHCPQIEVLEVPFARFKIRDRSCDLLWNGAFDAPLNDIFRVFPLPIVSFESVNLPPMKLISEAAKQNLKKLKLRDGLTGIFQETVLTDAVMYELASSFPNLTAISLSGCCDLTDAAMAYLAVGCRHLKQIGLHDSEYITDDGLIALFKAYTDVEQIVIEGMDHVTFRALIKIADLFPNLHTLGLIGLLIPSRTIFNLILERKLRAKIILCDDAQWIEEKLKEKHFHPLPKFHYR